MDFLMTAMAYSNGLSSSRNHVFFPILFPFKVFEFSHMVHHKFFRSSTYFAFLSFEPVYKACPTCIEYGIGHNVKASLCHRVLSFEPQIVEVPLFYCTRFSRKPYCEFSVRTILGIYFSR